tara:strand:+ start:7305 stop:7799 length:495 start_codon:yes stop_codon:yes gene_type:complete
MIETALLCLSLNMYFESRSESIAGQLAVAEVTLNRVSSPHYPNTICEVVLQDNSQGCQFSWWCDGRSDLPTEHHAFQKSKALAKLMLNDGEYISVVGDQVMHYHSQSVSPYWIGDFVESKQIGKHIFYEKKKKSPLSRPDKIICEQNPKYVYAMDTCIQYEKGV